MNCAFDPDFFFKMYQRGCSTALNAGQKTGFAIGLFDNRAGMVTSSSAFNKLREVEAEVQKEDQADNPTETASLAHDGDQTANISVRMHRLGRIREREVKAGLPNQEGGNGPPVLKDHKIGGADR